MNQVSIPDTSEAIRDQAHNEAKNFKKTWVDLGRILYTVYKDKLYKEWGFSTFESYIHKEIGIRKQTGIKLLRSYYFLEQDEPKYVEDKFLQDCDTNKVPEYESVDILRRAKTNKALEKEDYQKLRSSVFDQGLPSGEIKKGLTALIKQRQEERPTEELREERRVATIKRLLSVLKSLKQEIVVAKILPEAMVKPVDALIKSLEEVSL